MKAILALEDGRIFVCNSFTGPGEAAGEIVFNTGMTGYQEVLTDPSYNKQLVMMTYPLIGNYGVNPFDVESDKIQVAAFLMKEYQNYPSNFTSTLPLSDYLISNNVMGIDNFDTRALARHIRNFGSMRAYISTDELDKADIIAKAKSIPNMAGSDLVKNVTTVKSYYWINGKRKFIDNDKFISDTKKHELWKYKDKKYRVVAFDFGVKYNILRLLESSGCEVIVVPAYTKSSVIKDMEPDGIFLSNGPGDPEPLESIINNIKNLLDYKPIFGICLGHQILAIALGGNTYKLKFGHRGLNQPVMNLETKKVEISSQNHGFAVKKESFLNEDIKITYINLNDNTVEGFSHLKLPVFGVQFHPEASPGPNDTKHLFDKFVNLMKNKKNN